MPLAYKYIPRWAIMLLDIFLSIIALILAYIVRFNFNLNILNSSLIYKILLLVISVRFVLFVVFKTNAGIIRYTSIRDAIRIFLVVMLGSIFFVIANFVSYYFISGKFIIPLSVIVLEFSLTVLLLNAYRLLVRISYMELHNPSKKRSKVVIYGAGESGYITKRSLDRDVGTKHKVAAFIDDNLKKAGKKLEGVNIYGPDKLESIIQKESIEHIIIAIQNIASEKKKMIIEIALRHNIDIMNVPPVSKWINGELSFNQIKTINIESLLERDVIKLDESKIKQQLTGKVVLITGAAGSIGSEIVRQLLNYSLKKLILVDNGETALYHLELELQQNRSNISYEFIVGDIRHKKRMESIFIKYQPNVIYHAAAYKHVPLMELNPGEAVNTNIIGTKNIADLALKYQASSFVMVSTDKAVNPTSVMGATKRIAEIYTQALNYKTKTKYITTRFGNVLGSNGSVIPLFKKQIEKGGPITITHPEITRYFMTIPEACQLVLEAGAMSEGGEIFIFDMGKSVKIINLAKKMIRLSGLTLGKDIQIQYIGLRPGEKLYEELLTTGENTIRTYHPRIMIAKIQKYEYQSINKDIEDLGVILSNGDVNKIVGKMKEIVPEYKSNNSIFEEIDYKNSVNTL